MSRSFIHLIYEFMREIERFHQFFHYDAWANREVLDSFRVAGNPPARSLKLMSHILATEYVWFARLNGEKPLLPVWPELSLEECRQYALELPKTWSAYLDRFRENELAEKITYQNSKGESWMNTVQDILMHVIMHSAYHRGQIASDMRAAGHTPAYTDFIHAMRQTLVE
jgi:uncharacterized damage-inducible protein DinB